MEELISKKEVLQKYGISYGALYRWKRMGLIPEEWFIKRAATTGQETYFHKKAICERIEMILRKKDDCSLEEIAEALQTKQPQLPVIRIKWQYGEIELPIDDTVSAYLLTPRGSTLDITEALKRICKQEKE